MRRWCWIPALLLAACGDGPAVVATGAWVRAAPPGATATAGYLTLENGGDAELTVESVSSPGIRRLEIHETRMVDGVMRMRRLENVSVPAGGALVLEPGGRHLMLFGDPLPAEGQIVPLVIRLTDGSELRIDAAVRREAP